MQQNFILRLVLWNSSSNDQLSSIRFPNGVEKSVFLFRDWSPGVWDSSHDKPSSKRDNHQKKKNRVEKTWRLVTGWLRQMRQSGQVASDRSIQIRLFWSIFVGRLIHGFNHKNIKVRFFSIWLRLILGVAICKSPRIRIDCVSGMDEWSNQPEWFWSRLSQW